MRSLIIRLFILLGLFFPVPASAVTLIVAAGSCCPMALKSDGTVMALVWNDVAKF